MICSYRYRLHPTQRRRWDTLSIVPLPLLSVTYKTGTLGGAAIQESIG